MRIDAFTGRTDTVQSWLAGRQTGRWLWQGSPTAARTAPADPARALRELTELHQRGVVTDGEFERIRARLGV
jgi:hypothetical protein